jgi:hypothetical protein
MMCEWLIRVESVLANSKQSRKYPHHGFDLVYILALILGLGSCVDHHHHSPPGYQVYGI